MCVLAIPAGDRHLPVQASTWTNNRHIVPTNKRLCHKTSLAPPLHRATPPRYDRAVNNADRTGSAVAFLAFMLGRRGEYANHASAYKILNEFMINYQDDLRARLQMIALPSLSGVYK